jgi:hypothetical protein
VKEVEFERWRWVWDSGVFVEMKHLFSIAPKDGTGGEVTEVIVAIF